jgi:hypothetical protein
MVLKSQQLKIVMPPDIHDIFHMLIKDQNGLIYAMQRVMPHVMQKLQEKPVDGFPSYFCFSDSVITVYPRPDRDFPNVIIEYLMKRAL